MGTGAEARVDASVAREDTADSTETHHRSLHSRSLLSLHLHRQLSPRLRLLNGNGPGNDRVRIDSSLRRGHGLERMREAGRRVRGTGYSLLMLVRRLRVGRGRGRLEWGVGRGNRRLLRV